MKSRAQAGGFGCRERTTLKAFLSRTRVDVDALILVKLSCEIRREPALKHVEIPEPFLEHGRRGLSRMEERHEPIELAAVRAVVAEHQEVHERPAFRVELVQPVGLCVPRRLAIDGQ